MRRYSLFVVDDDDFYIQSVRLALGPSWHVSDKIQTADAALVDIHLSGHGQDFEGLKEIHKARKARPSLQIIATSGDLNRDTMEKALEAGCDLFLGKPLKPEQLTRLLEKVAAYQQLRELPGKPTDATWIGSSQPSEKIKSQIAQLKNEPGPILIQGETGTGKEVVAQLLHQQEEGHAFVRVNVASLSKQLFESELFGHVKGAFTGALQDKMGLIEAADGGDLFLDEIETLDESQQASLLRFLENNEIKAVGSTQVKNVSVRVIAATNENLEALVKAKKFREDLYWRFAKHIIQLPALRERTQDIKDLCEWFFQQISNEPKEITQDGLAALQKMPWTGNVRELKRACEKLHLYAPLPILREEDIHNILKTSTTGSMNNLDYHVGLDSLMKNHEAMILRNCLNNTADVEEAARILKISRSSIYKKLKDHNIDWEKQS